MASYKDNNLGNLSQNKGFFSKILRNISNWGMDTDEMVMRNTNAIPINQTPVPVGTSVDNMYDIVSRNAVAKILQTKAISYLDRGYMEKQRILREYARKDEIRDFVTIVADEAIMYSEDEDYCLPSTLSEEFSDEIKKKYQENFKKIYNIFGFNNGIIAWNYFRTLLIDGFLAFEIIYDDKNKNIIGINQLEPSTLLPSIEPTTGDSIWIQYPESPEFRRILLDSQIIYISYASGAEFSETSYVENLIRPYNQLKLLEQTRIMFNVMNAMVNRLITIPVAGMSRSMAEEQLAKIIMDFKDEVSFNEEFGVVTINGSPHISYNKDFVITEGESGKPTVENIEFKGHNLNENDLLTWFYNALKRASKIPFSRFDKTNGGGNIFGDVTDMSRDELHFFHFIQRLRTVFKEIIVKPWKIKMMLDFPELEKDENFISKINLQFNGSNLFHEWKKLNNLSKRAEVAGTLAERLKGADDKPYFAVEWLVREIMKMDEETLKENDRWKKRAGVGAVEGGGAGADLGGGGADLGGGDLGTPDFGGGDTGGDTGADLGGDTSPTPAPAPDAGGEATPDTGGDDFDF
jgi:hypothetical protein